MVKEEKDEEPEGTGKSAEDIKAEIESIKEQLA